MRTSLGLFEKLGLRPSPFLRVEGYKQHVFKWGVGSDYMRKNSLRMLPPTIPRPRESTIPDNYFESFTLPNPTIEAPHAIRFCHVNEHWEVYWWEYNKQHAKPFPVKKYGVEGAKREAKAYAERLLSSGKMNPAPTHNHLTEAKHVSMEEKSSILGPPIDPSTTPSPHIWWDDRLQCWFGENSKGFSATEWGYSAARLRASDSAKSTTEWMRQLELAAKKEGDEIKSVREMHNKATPTLSGNA